jgi:D-arabinan endo alpha-(1,5)-arabinofuranosidase
VKRGFFILPLLLAAGLSMTHAQGATPAPALTGVADVEFVGWVSGPDSINQTGVKYDVDGADLGSMFDANGTLWIAFGDTFGCCRPEGGGAGGENWRNNVLAYSTDHDLTDGITFDGMITGPDGHARAVLRKGRDDATLIPTNGIGIGSRIYLHYMAVKEWGPPGEWTLNRSGWAYSDDQGQTWTQPADAVWQGDTQFGQAALLIHDDMLYIFGIHGGRFGGAALARVPQAQVLDMTAYTYWDGAAWVSDADSAAVVADAPVGELSVAWNDYLGRWIMTYLNEFRRAIVIREAPELTGPWSEPLTLVSGDDYPSLYGAFLHPWGSDGETIYFNMSQWGPYNVMLMRARLVKAE